MHLAYITCWTEQVLNARKKLAQTVHVQVSFDSVIQFMELSICIEAVPNQFHTLSR